jgi:hypothetical protein
MQVEVLPRRLLVRIFDSSEAGFASGWSADILVRSVPGLDTEAETQIVEGRTKGTGS